MSEDLRAGSEIEGLALQRAWLGGYVPPPPVLRPEPEQERAAPHLLQVAGKLVVVAGKPAATSLTEEVRALLASNPGQAFVLSDIMLRLNGARERCEITPILCKLRDRGQVKRGTPVQRQARGQRVAVGVAGRAADGRVNRGRLRVPLVPYPIAGSHRLTALKRSSTVDVDVGALPASCGGAAPAPARSCRSGRAGSRRPGSTPPARRTPRRTQNTCTVAPQPSARLVSSPPSGSSGGAGRRRPGTGPGRSLRRRA
jgi:hypothetical protein